MSDKNKPLVIALLLLIAGKTAVNLLFSAQIINLQTNLELANHLTTAKVLLGMIVLKDTTIAATLVALLSRRKSGFVKSDSLMNKIMAVVVGKSVLGQSSNDGGFTGNFRHRPNNR